MAKKNDYTFPVPDMQKKFLLAGFGVLKILLEMPNNPFTQSFSQVLHKEKGITPFFAFIDRCMEQKEGANWTFPIKEVYSLYILLDLTVRIYRAGFYVYLHKMFEKYGCAPLESAETVERSQRHTLGMAEDALNYLDGLKENTFIASYIWKADRFPDPITGISPLMAAYNHIPNLPKNPPQMFFSDYGDKIAFIYDKKLNLATWVKDINCINTITLVLADIENPPARIITAYFPKIKEELSALLSKLIPKLKQRKIKLTEGEFGLFYACSDLYGRLNASSYHNIMHQLDKNRPIHKPRPEMSDELETLQKQITKTALDKDVKRMNEEFGHYAVIQDYRRVAGEMVWFDD